MDKNKKPELNLKYKICTPLHDELFNQLLRFSSTVTGSQSEHTSDHIMIRSES